MMTNWGEGQSFSYSQTNEPSGQPPSEHAVAEEARPEEQAGDHGAYWNNGAGAMQGNGEEPGARANGLDGLAGQDGNGFSAEAGGHAAQPEAQGQQISELGLPRGEPVPDFETAASECFNRALFVSLSLGHTCLSSHHLMLALTMDPLARKYLERLGDIDQLRERAMYKLGKMNTKFQQGGVDLPQLSRRRRQAISTRSARPRAKLPTIADRGWRSRT